MFVCSFVWTDRLILNEISEPLLRIDTAANLPRYPLRSMAQQKLPSKGPLVASPLGATPARAALSCLRIQGFNSIPLGRALS